jgi:hypothetical protein
MTASGPWSRTHLPRSWRAADSATPAWPSSLMPWSNITFLGSIGGSPPDASASELSEGGDGEEEEGGAFETPLSSSTKGGFSLRGRPPFAPWEPPLWPCAAPAGPPAARASRISSSRTIRRLKIKPSGVVENTSFSLNSASQRRTGATPSPTKRASASGPIGRPSTTRCPYGVASCIKHIMSIQSPRAAVEHRRKPASFRQSLG